MHFVKGVFLHFRDKKYQLFLLLLKAYSLKNIPQKCFLEETKLSKIYEIKWYGGWRSHDRSSRAHQPIVITGARHYLHSTLKTILERFYPIEQSFVPIWALFLFLTENGAVLILKCFKTLFAFFPVFEYGHHDSKKKIKVRLTYTFTLYSENMSLSLIEISSLR